MQRLVTVEGEVTYRVRTTLLRPSPPTTTKLLPIAPRPIQP